MKIISILLTAIALLILVTATKAQNLIDSNTIKDVDSNIYPVLLYRGYNYMTENLKVTRFVNGDKIIESKTTSDWKNYCTKGIPTYMINKNYPELGKIYNGYAVYDSRGLLPVGYIIPTDSIFYEEYWTRKYEGNEKNRSEFEKMLLGKISLSTNAYNSDCTKSKSFYIEPDGKIYDKTCVGGRWWMEESEDRKHTDNSFSIACCTGRDGAHFGEYPKPDWQSWGFYIRGVKKQ